MNKEPSIIPSAVTDLLCAGREKPETHSLQQVRLRYEEQANARFRSVTRTRHSHTQTHALGEIHDGVAAPHTTRETGHCALSMTPNQCSLVESRYRLHRASYAEGYVCPLCDMMND